MQRRNFELLEQPPVITDHKKRQPRRLSFQMRIFLGCLCIALVPLVVASFLMVKVFDRSLTQNARQDAKNKVFELESRLDFAFEGYQNISEYFTKDAPLAKALIDKAPNIQNEVYATLYGTAGGLQKGAEFSLYDAGGKLRFSTGSNGALEYLPANWGILKLANLVPNHMVYCSSEQLASNSPAMQTAQTLVFQNGAQVGFAVIGLSSLVFEELFSGLAPAQSLVMLLDETGHLVYSSHPQKAVSCLGWLRNQLMEGRLESSDSGSYYYTTQNKRSGFYVVLQQSKPYTDTTLQTMGRISFITALFCLGLCLIFSIIISGSLSRPVRALTKAMKQAKQGRLDIQVKVSGKDELGQLTENFNQMAAELEQYMQRTLKHQTEMNEAQMRLLQTQLNPHFLYNTLDTVKWLAKMHKVPEIADISSNLAIILRQCVSAEQFVTLRQELDMIQSYIEIQRIRFSGRFRYVVELPEQLEECMIPKLVLQPIVENSILHGLAEKEDGYIYLMAVKKGNDVEISVTDDGCGMPQTSVDRLNQPKIKMLEGHLGLYNVGSILQLHYGTGYGVFATSRPGVGTTITIKIPFGKQTQQSLLSSGFQEQPQPQISDHFT